MNTELQKEVSAKATERGRATPTSPPRVPRSEVPMTTRKKEKQKGKEEPEEAKD